MMKALLTSALVLVLAGFTVAGDWHVTGSLRCGDCHYQHGTQSGLEAPGGPFSYMLKKSSVNELCLSCHDGNDPTAPDVLAPTPMYSATAAGESSGGTISTGGLGDHTGHTMGITVDIPLQYAMTSVTLNCASCHAVHGNGNFRNLLLDPAQRGDSISIEHLTDLFEQYAPAQPPSMAGSVQAYQRGNVLYRSEQYTSWCVSCHDVLANTAGAASPAHFAGHPSNIAINHYSIDAHTDPTHWRGGSGSGFGDAGTGIVRVPALSPTATDFLAATTARESDKVFCLSCHKAHGGANATALLWPYTEGGNNYIAGCQQCHNK